MKVLFVFLLLWPLSLLAQPPEEPEPPSAKIVCINTPIVNTNQDLGDVVAVFPGDHEFSAHEQSVFTIIHVPGVSPGQVQEAIDFVASTPGQEKKYMVSIANLTAADITFLEDPEETLADKVQLLKNKLKDNTQ
jgi:hypothetical protein